MNILTRHVCFELLRVFLTAVFALTALMLLVGVVEQALREGLGPAHLLRLLPFLLPTSLVFAIPATLLLAVTVVYGRMSADNEVLAIQAAGRAPGLLLWPAVGLGFVLSLATVWLYELGVTWGQRGARQVAIEALEDVVYRDLRVRGSFEHEGFRVFVEGVEGRRMVRPLMSFRANGDSPAVTLQAAEAELQLDAQALVLTVICRNGLVSLESGETFRFPDTFQHPVRLDWAAPKNPREESPQRVPLALVDQCLKDQKKTIADLERDLALLAGRHLLLGDFADLTRGSAATLERDLEAARGRLARLRTEPPRRWASGFSCLAFVLLGAPWAIRRRQADFVTNFFVCFTPILLIYYPFFQYSLDRAKAGALPPQLVWIANLVLALAGLWLIRGLHRRA